MKESFGGNAQVEDVEKARAMAEAGNTDRTIAAGERQGTNKMSEHWLETPEEVITISESIANRREEIVGIIHDLQESLKGKSSNMPSIEKINAIKIMVEMALTKGNEDSN